MVVNLSLNQTLLTFLLSVRQTWMAQLILAISLWGYLPLNRKDCSTRIHGLAVYVKEGLRFARDLSLENSVFYWLYFTQCFNTFSSIDHLLLLSITFYRSPSSSINHLLSITFFFYRSPSSIDHLLQRSPSSSIDHLLLLSITFFYRSPSIDHLLLSITFFVFVQSFWFFFI